MRKNKIPTSRPAIFFAHPADRKRFFTKFLRVASGRPECARAVVVHTTRLQSVGPFRGRSTYRPIVFGECEGVLREGLCMESVAPTIDVRGVTWC